MMVFQAIVAALAPTFVYSLLLWWLDRYEKEPLHLIAAAFLWGAVPAIVLAVIFELVLSVPIDRSPLGPNAANWGLAPLVEEVLKALALAGLFLWTNGEFDGPLDGIVYGALIGFGFSMTENALYFLNYGELGELFWVRGVLFGLNHAFFTSLVGLALGAVRYQRNAQVLVLSALGGLSAAILFHATHNYLATEFSSTGLVFSWMIQSAGVVLVLAVAMLAWRHELGWMRNELGEEVRAGVISAEEYRVVTSSFRRAQREFHALSSGGITSFRQIRKLHHLITELAFCKSKQRLADRYQDCLAAEQTRDAIIALRETISQQPGVYA